MGGRLSFSHIGHTNYPKSCGGLNESDQLGRVVLCTQERPTSDSLVSASYLKFVFGFETVLQFVLIAETVAIKEDAQGALKGTILVFSRGGWTTSAGASQSPAGWMSDEIHRVTQAGQSGGNQAATLRASMPTIISSLRPSSAYTVDCEIYRSGKAVLELSGTAKKLLFAPSVAHSAAEMADRDIQYICNQAFMFLKDVAHNHRHHHKKQDTITLAYPEDDKSSWIRDTAYSIHRRVIVKRRSSEPKELYDALGLMAYMASLKKLADAEYEESDNKEEMTGAKIAASYNLKETEDSIKATLERRRWQRTQWNIVITAVPAIMISSSSLLKPTSGDESTSKTAFSAISDLANFLFPYDLNGAILLLVVLSIVPWAYGAINPARFGLVDYAKRVLVVLNRETHASVFGYLGAFFLSLAVVAIAMGIWLPNIDVALFGWWIFGFIVISSSLFLWLAPYVATIPDLFAKLRKDFSEKYKMRRLQ